MTIVQNGKKCESARVNYETLCYIINRHNAYNLSAFITLQRKTLSFKLHSDLKPEIHE